MATVPTGKLERELRRLYMRWVHQLPRHQDDMHNYVAKFQRDSIDLIERMGGDIARLGILADFPAPKRLDLSLHIGTIYSDMELAAISAQIGLGLNPRQTAEALVQSGVDKSYRRLERLARTETVRAYWKNSWDSVEGLGLVMLWSAERGPRTCEWCLERDGMVVPSREVRDHPNGRCTLIAELPSKINYKGSVASDGSIYQDPDWTKPASQETRLLQPSEWTDSDLAPIYQAPTTPGINGYEPLRPALERQGYKGPQIVPEDVFDAVETESLYRGLSLRDVPLQDMLNNFHATSDYYIGSGIYGNGWYFSNRHDIAAGYAGWSGVVSEAKLSPTARIFRAGVVDSAEDIMNMPEFAWTKAAKYAGTPVATDPSVAATMMGYDAIFVQESWNGKVSDFTIVLNRSALFMKEGPK